MKKMFHLLENVTGYNSFREVSQYEVVAGNQQDVYIRLIQKEAKGNCPPGECDNRYVPAIGSTLTVTFDNIDSALVITRVATMVYPNDDRSIFRITLLPGDKLNGAMKDVLNEGSVNETILLDGRLVVTGTDDSRFFC